MTASIFCTPWPRFPSPPSPYLSMRWWPSKGRRWPIRPKVQIWEMVRMIATARVLMPEAMVRLSAGRVNMTEQDQALCFLAGANSIFAGEKLLTTANPELDADRRMFERLGVEAEAGARGIAMKVVVTGLGLYTGLGSEPEPTWRAIRERRSAAVFSGSRPELRRSRLRRVPVAARRPKGQDGLLQGRHERR